MIVIPEWEWGANNLLIPVSIFLILYSILAQRGLEYRPWRFAVACLLLLVVTVLLYFQFGSVGERNIPVIAVVSAVVTMLLYVFSHLFVAERSPAANTILITGFLAASLGTYMKISYGAWGIFVPVGTGFIYALAVFHCTQRIAICIRLRRIGIALPLTADLLFLIAALFHLDADDVSSYVILDHIIPDILDLDLIGQSAPSIGEWLGFDGNYLFNGLVHLPLFAVWLWIEVALKRKDLA